MSSARRIAAAVGIAILAVAAVVAVIVARAATILEAHRDDLLGAVAGSVGWPVEAESLDASWFPPSIVAVRPRVPDVSPFGPGDLVSADEARFEFALLPLLRGRLVVTEVRLQAPLVRVVRGAEGGWNLTRPLAAPPERPRSDGPDWPAPEVVVDTVRVRNGRVLYRDRAIPGMGEIEVKSVNLRFRNGARGLLVDWNASALGGPAENLSGRIWVPAAKDGGTSVAQLEIEVDRFDASRLPDVVAVLRGRFPFGLTLGGEATARVTAEMNATWPPGAAAIDLTVDAERTTVRGGGGWIAKPAGSTLQAEARLTASGEALALDRLLLRAGDAELRAEATSPASADAPPPLALQSQGLDARTIGEWVPALAALGAHGPLALRGKLTPGRGPLGAELELTGSELGLVADERPLDVGRLALRLLLSDDGKRVLSSLRIDDVRGRDASAGMVEVAIGGSFGEPIAAKLSLAHGSVRGAPLERIEVEAVVGEGGADIRSATADALGGKVRAQGRAEWRDGARRLVLEPEWSGIDLRALLLAVGETARAHGTLRGRARLSGSVGDVESLLSTLAGDFEAALVEGEIVDLNVAAATVGNIRGVPRLREAVERRARERAPDLLAATTRIALLDVRGAIAERGLAVASLGLESATYALEAKGRIGFDGETDMVGTLLLAPATAQALVADSSVAQLLAAPNGQVRIPVTVRGTYPSLTSAPTSEFLTRLAARAISAPGEDPGGGWLGRFLRGRAAEREPADEGDAR